MLGAPVPPHVGPGLREHSPPLFLPLTLTILVILPVIAWRSPPPHDVGASLKVTRLARPAGPVTFAAAAPFAPVTTSNSRVSIPCTASCFLELFSFTVGSLVRKSIFTGIILVDGTTSVSYKEPLDWYPNLCVTTWFRQVGPAHTGPPAHCAAALHARGCRQHPGRGQRGQLRLRALLMVVVMVIPRGVMGTRPAAQGSLCSAFCSGAASAM